VEPFSVQYHRHEWENHWLDGIHEIQLINIAICQLQIGNKNKFYKYAVKG